MLSASVLRNLEGSRFMIDGEVAEFERAPPKEKFAASVGSEGVAAPILLGKQRCMLKMYYLPSEERHRRINFLCKLQLGNLLPAFAAAPSRVARGTLHVKVDSKAEPKPLSVEGYLAPFVAGETLELLVEKGEDVSTESRVKVAVDLCCAVEVLEAADLVHGDLQPRNLIIKDWNSTSPQLHLIDFDGFFHPDWDRIPLIPTADVRGGRPGGCPGYLHRRYAKAKGMQVITSDRMALAALVYEIMVLRCADFELLPTISFLNQDDISQGTASAPEMLIVRWPEGWQLVQRAVQAESAEEAPSPAEWLEALRGFANRDLMITQMLPHVEPPKASSVQRPLFLLIEDGETGFEWKEGLNQLRSSLGHIDPALDWLFYSQQGGRLFLEGKPHPGTPEIIKLKLGQKRDQRTGQFGVEVHSGDLLKWARFHIKVCGLDLPEDEAKEKD